MSGWLRVIARWVRFPTRFLAGSAEIALRNLVVLAVFYAGLELLAVGGSLLGVKLSGMAAAGIIGVSALTAWYYGRQFRVARDVEAESGLAASGFFFLTVLVYLLLWFLARALPDFSYDGNYYHTPPIHFWIRSGSIHWIGAGLSPHWGPIALFPWNGYPKAIETVGYLFLLAAGSGRLLNSLNLLFLPLGFLSVVSLSRTLGARAGYALAAGCLFVLLPVNLAQSLTAMVDTGSAACYLAFFAVYLAAARAIRKGEIPWRSLIGLGAAWGLAVGSKAPGIVLIPAGALLLLARRRWFGRRPVGDGHPAGSVSFSRVLLFSSGAVLLAIAVGGFWTVRNWIETGNPLHPVEINLAGREIFPGVDIDIQHRPPYDEGSENWTQAERILANWTNCLRGNDLANLVYDSRRGGLGIAWLASIPALIWVLLGGRKAGETKPAAAGFVDLLLIGLVMFFVMPRHHNHMARYTIWLAGLGLPCLAVVTGRMGTATGKQRWKKSAAAVWLGAVFLLAGRETIASLRLHISFLETFRGREAAVVSPLQVLPAGRSPYPSGYYWNDLNGTIMEMIMAGVDPVGVAIAEKNQRHLIFGHLVQGEALGRRDVIFIDHLRAESDPGYLSRLIEGNAVRYIIWDSTLPLNPILVNDSVREDYGLGKGLWHVFTFPPEKLNAL